jgi:serine/threonine-protein kinase
MASGQISLFITSKDTAWLVRAETSAREAIAIDSSRSESHRALAYVLGARKRYVEAEREYRIACSSEPTDDDSWYAWGRMWLRLGKPDEERAVYASAASLRPHCFKPYWWLASWQYRNGHIAEAIAGFREMIRRAPDYFNGYANLGGLLLFEGRYDSAIDTLRLAIRLRPDATVFSNLGTAYFNLGRLSPAVDAYNQAFQFDEAGYENWLNLGDAFYWLRGSPDQARAAYRQGVRLGREQLVERAQRGSSPDAMIAAHLASVLPKLAEPESARAMLQQALAIDSLNSRVQYQAALTKWQLGEREAAVAWLRRAVAGGFPIVWLRDSPIHRDWRTDPGFQALLMSATPAGDPRSPGKGDNR